MADPVSIIAGGIQIVSGFLGSGERKCEAKQRKIEQDIMQYLTPQDIQELGSIDPERIGFNPEKMAYFFVGEKDCKHKNVGARHQRFLNELPARIARRKREADVTAFTPTQSRKASPGAPAGVNAGASAFEMIPAWVYLVGAALVGGIAWLSFQGRP